MPQTKLTRLESAAFHEGRVAVISALSDKEFDRDEQVTVLSHVASQLHYRQLIQAVLTAAGYEVVDFLCDRSLEVYFNIEQAGLDVGYVAKGWIDEGMRFGQLVDMKRTIKSGDRWLADLSQFCATDGICCTFKRGSTYVTLECIVYAVGFNAATVRSTLESLSKCMRRAEEMKDVMLKKSIEQDVQ